MNSTRGTSWQGMRVRARYINSTRGTSWQGMRVHTRYINSTRGTSWQSMRVHTRYIKVHRRYILVRHACTYKVHKVHRRYILVRHACTYKVHKRHHRHTSWFTEFSGVCAELVQIFSFDYFHRSITRKTRLHHFQSSSLLSIVAHPTGGIVPRVEENIQGVNGIRGCVRSVTTVCIGNKTVQDTQSQMCVLGIRPCKTLSYTCVYWE